ncbi:unnamed protein product, partial [Discosporangium mesarthrocarpum]
YGREGKGLLTVLYCTVLQLSTLFSVAIDLFSHEVGSEGAGLSPPLPPRGRTQASQSFVLYWCSLPCHPGKGFYPGHLAECFSTSCPSPSWESQVLEGHGPTSSNAMPVKYFIG